jgi:hypothetical protein
VIDHLVYATRDVDATAIELSHRLGVKPAAGGRHLGYGTRNALLSLGSSYLEIIGPDEGQPRPSGGYWYGIENIHTPRLFTWTARVEHIEAVAAHAHASGYKPGDVHKVFRQLPNGDELSFELTLPTGAGDGLVPNLIEWAVGSAHPSQTSPGGIELLGLRGYHPVPESITPMLDALGVDLELRVGETPKLVAILDAPYGPIELA